MRFCLHTLGNDAYSIRLILFEDLAMIQFIQIRCVSQLYFWQSNFRSVKLIIIILADWTHTVYHSITNLKVTKAIFGLYCKIDYNIDTDLHILVRTWSRSRAFLAKMTSVMLHNHSYRRPTHLGLLYSH